MVPPTGELTLKIGSCWGWWWWRWMALILKTPLELISIWSRTCGSVSSALARIDKSATSARLAIVIECNITRASAPSSAPEAVGVELSASYASIPLTEPCSCFRLPAVTCPLLLPMTQSSLPMGMVMVKVATVLPAPAALLGTLG